MHRPAHSAEEARRGDVGQCRHGIDFDTDCAECLAEDYVAEAPEEREFINGGW